MKTSPKLVMMASDEIPTTLSDEIFTTVVSLVKNVVTISCPNCGVIRRGIWKAQSKLLTFSNLEKPICCNKFKNKLMRITHNNWGSFIKVENGVLDRTKFEGNILGLFLDKYEIAPTFINANFKWGSIDPDTGKWTGMVGNVRVVDA